ncbi:hypothetical protein AX16_005051 [Volvariella volvacea WC 439]|nr:hypothetical protein AX16_005051 [Volvariella volvacea WC 439]
MPFPHIEAQPAEIDSEIHNLTLKLAELRRRRNGLMPLLETPPNSSAKYYNTFPWTATTQFCTDWRIVALNHPALWTNARTKSLGWFSTFLERSQSQLLHVHASDRWATDVDCEKIFHFIVANMHRIRSLRLDNLRSSDRFLRLKNVPASQLEVLQFGENLSHSELSLSSSVSSGIMQKLRQLRLEHCASRDWNCILPLHLPTITDVAFTNVDTDSQIELLSRCPSVRRLSIMNGWIASDNPTPVELPNLEYLALRYTGWFMSDYLTFPAISFVDITSFSNPEDSELANIFTRFSSALGRIIHPRTSTNIGQRLHHLSLDHDRSKLSITARTETGEGLAMFSIQVNSSTDYDDHIDADDDYPLFFASILELAQTASSGISSISIGSSSGSERLLSGFCHHPHTSTTRIQTLAGFKSLVSFSDSRDTAGVRPVSEWANQRCKCMHCHNRRIASFPGLQTLTLDLLTDGTGREVLLDDNMMEWFRNARRVAEGERTRGFGTRKT